MTTDRKPDFRPGVPACLAPPLTAADLDRFEDLAAVAPPAIADSMRELIAMVGLFFETPRSALPSHDAPAAFNRRGRTIRSLPCTPLEDDEVARIWDAVPWEHELDAMGALFEAIPNETEKPLRDAAFHLLWYGRELVRDREPMTNELVDG